MEKNIKFTSIYQDIPKIFAPRPASTCIPDWYKKQESYMGNKKEIGINGNVNPTIKKCIPIFDSITAGYILFSAIDINLQSTDLDISYMWPNSFKKKDGELIAPVVFHQNTQINQYPRQGLIEDMPKFTNPWSIKTPNGYSVLITQPMHRDLPFQILPAIVDTDKYHEAVHFPFYFKNPKWTGLISAGTPIAQVIPFKREDWSMSIGGEDDAKLARESFNTVKSFFFNGYKDIFWSKKIFK